MTPRVAGNRGSTWSLWSQGSFLSVASKGSALSIGSVGSFLSVGSVGSAFSAFSVGSFASLGSALSSVSRWSLLSHRGDRATMGRREGRVDLTVVLVAVELIAAAGATWARRRTAPDHTAVARGQG